MKITWVIGLFCALICWSSHGQNQKTDLTHTHSDHINVALVTVHPGDIYWERFGHNAILIRNTTTDKDQLYNYGMFDFAQENFLINFLRGRMQYQLAVTTLANDLAIYQQEKRAVDIQWLNLTSLQKQTLYDFLQWNVQPENTTYPYDYFYNNCSTKVRDALNHTLNGLLYDATTSRSKGWTLRMHTLRLTSPTPWLYLGIHAGMGRTADQGISFWDEMFIPMALQQHIRTLTIVDDNGLVVPFVQREQQLLASGLPETPKAPPNNWLYFLAFGMSLALLNLFLAQTQNSLAIRIMGAISLCIWTVAGIIGLILCTLWLATQHKIAYHNGNILLFNPLCLLLLPTAWRWLRYGQAQISQTARILLMILPILAIGISILNGLPWLQQNLRAWLVFWLPIHAGFFGVYRTIKNCKTFPYT